MWWCSYYDLDGIRHQTSTKQVDRKAAEDTAAELRRRATDPHYAAAKTFTIRDAVGLLLRTRAEEATAGRKSEDTVGFYQVKTGQLLRVFEGAKDEVRRPFLLVDLSPTVVDGYISQRRAEGVGGRTISKEIVDLLRSVRLRPRRSSG